MFRHAYVVCLCLVCILWQFSVLVEDTRGDHMEEAYSSGGHMTALVEPLCYGVVYCV